MIIHTLDPGFKNLDHTIAVFVIEGPDGLVLVETGDTIPGDGEVIKGIAYVSEAAITGESAPVLKEPGTDISSSVTG